MKALQKLLISLAVLILLLGAASAFLFAETQKQMNLENRSFTKAICNENNYCEDYLISCSGNKILEMKFTGYAVQFSDGWKDLRDEEAKEKLC